MSSISVSQIISILRTMVVPRMPIALEAFLSLIFRIHTRRTIQPSPQPLLAQPSLGIETHPNSDQQQQQQQQQQEEEEHDSPPPLNLVPRDEIPSSPICTIQDRLTAAENEIAELRRYIASVEQLLHDHLANYCRTSLFSISLFARGSGLPGRIFARLYVRSTDNKDYSDQVHIETGAETGPSAPIVIPLRGSPERDPIPIDNRMTFDMDSDFGRIHPEPNSPNPFVSTASPARDWMRFVAERVQPPPHLSQAQPTIGENMLGLELFNPPDLEPLSPVDGDSDQLIPRGPGGLSGMRIFNRRRERRQHSQELGTERSEVIGPYHRLYATLDGSPQAPALGALEVSDGEDDLFDHDFILEEEPPTPIDGAEGMTTVFRETRLLPGRRNTTEEEPIKIRRHTD
ncbi:hypothetical protein FRC14_000598 [Serendipita sp. 396]|nr:hypothetical protein FRC14_000598 [Serendipita sp. 396]